ncbi:porin [Paraburkholderia saeva]|uniref:Outer membrane porin protein 32 n=1 Tax=Paraburkholderia saeva TaxID=2777537 RepID=A0A9N8S1V8_9BURK|nr:porin [Paraburkholderia saeva]CAG4912152.1 Outer membrane porin protein 32 [Paraburkholderia saeva]CAG4924672.1 Outer membrane porin protein 32 [Paraburkholderia saeva]
MKRKLVVAALTVMGTNAAMAQSSVTLYGLADLEVGKYDGSNAIRMNTGATSFWGLKGVEDLGGGYRAIFQLEQQFNPNNGTFYNSSSFFSGRSTVGLEGWFGHLALGRDVNASHYAEVSADPFGQNGLASGYGARGGISEANGGPGQIDTVRTNNSANYMYKWANVTFRAQVAARDSAVTGNNIPYSTSIVYEDPKLKLAASFIRPQGDNAHWAYTSGQYDFGIARLYAGYGFGQNTFSQEMHNQMVGINIPLGPAQQILSTFSHTTANGRTIQCRSVLGYFYFLSKATSVYADVVYDTQSGHFTYGTTTGWEQTGTSTNGLGYTVGLRHAF